MVLRKRQEAPTNRLRELTAPLHSHDFRQLWLSQVLSEVGDWAARLALAVLVLDRSGSEGISALVTTASLLPWIGIGQWLAAQGDRLSRRRVMVASDLARGALFAALAIPMPTAVVLAIVFIAGCAAPPFEAARSALLPSTVSREAYGSAISLASATYQLAIIGGALAGGGLVAAVGARAAILFNAISFLGSAFFVSRLRVGTRPASTEPNRIRDALYVVRTDTWVRRAAFLMCGLAGSGIIVEALIPAYVEGRLGMSGLAVGLAAATLAAGNLVVTVGITAHGRPRRLLERSAVVAIATGGLALIVFALDPGYPGVLVAFAASGAVFGSAVPANVVLGTRIPDNVRAAAFGFLGGALQVSSAIGAAVGGLVASRFGPQTACLVGSGAIVAVGCVLFFSPVRRATPTKQP